MFHWCISTLSESYLFQFFAWCKEHCWFEDITHSVKLGSLNRRMIHVFDLLSAVCSMVWVVVFEFDFCWLLDEMEWEKRQFSQKDCKSVSNLRFTRKISCWGPNKKDAEWSERTSDQISLTFFLDNNRGMKESVRNKRKRQSFFLGKEGSDFIRIFLSHFSLMRVKRGSD